MAFPRLSLLVIALVVSIFPTAAQNSFGFRKISSWPGFTRGTPADIVVVDNYAYVAMGEGGLCIVDVTSRTAPVVAGRLDLPGNATRIKVFGEYAFLACGAAGLQIVNVANPTAPSLASSFETGGTAMGIGWAYPYAFIADGLNGVVVADVRNPAAPTLATQINLPGTVYDLEAVLVTGDTTPTNRYLQVVNGTNGFLAYRVTDPLSPQLLFHDVAPGFDARAITRFGRDVYWSERNFISHYDFTRLPPQTDQVWVINNWNTTLPITKMVVPPFTRPLNPPFYLFSGSASFYAPPSSGAVFAARRAGAEVGLDDPGDGYQYYLDNTKGLTIYRSGTGSLVSATPIGAEASRIKLAGNRLYVTDSQQGLEILTTNANGALTSQSRYFDGYLPLAFDVAASNVFVWTAGTNLNVLDVTDATQPQFVSNVAPILTNKPTDISGNDVIIRDGFAYVSGQNLGLAVLNVSNPALPTLARRSSINGLSLYSMNLVGTNIFASELRGLASVAINADKSATRLGAVVTSTTGLSQRRMRVAGSTAYFCDRENGLKIYDVSDPANMVLLSTYDTPGGVFSVAVNGSFAYVSDQRNGILVLDVSNPSNPTLVATLPLANSAFDLEVVGNRLYVAHGAEGVSVWDLVPRQAQTIDFPAIADKAANTPPFTIAATASSGLPVQFQVISGPATIQGNKVTLYGAGSVTIRATQAGNDEFSAIFADRTFAATLATQTLNIPEITGKTTRSASFELSVSSDSGLPVGILLLGPAYIGTTGFVTNKGIVTITGAGTVTVRVSQQGNSIWAPIQIERTFTIVEQARDLQTILMPAPSILSIDDDPFAFPINASSGLPVDVTVTGPVTLENGTMTVTGQGSVSVTASQAGDRDFEPVIVTRTFEVYDLPGAATANVVLRNPSLPSAETAPDADPDHDGLPNIVEFILKSDPTSFSSMEGHITGTLFEAAGSRYLKAHYFKPRTMRYPVAIQVGDFAKYPNIIWQSVPAGFNEDGTGDFYWAVNPTYKFPLIRFAVHYP